MASAARKSPSNLGTFEGHPVLAVGVAIRNAGDGLSDALRIDPAQLKAGEKVHVVIEATVAEIGFKPINKDEPGGAVRRVHVLKAGTALIMDDETITAAIEEQRVKVRKAQEDEAGIIPMFDDEGAPKPKGRRGKAADAESE